MMILQTSLLAPIEYRFEFDALEINSLNLMRAYERLRRSYCEDSSYLLFSRKKDPRKSRFFKSFKKLVIESESKGTTIPYPELFIKSQFEILRTEYHTGNIYCPPQYLFSKYAWRRYRRYINQLSMNKNIKINNNKKTRSNKINVIRDLRETHSFIKSFSINNFGEQEVNYKNIFADSRIWICILNQTISPYFLSISKSFSETRLPNAIQEEIPNDFDIYKKEIMSDKEIINIAKELFKDEIDE